MVAVDPFPAPPVFRHSSVSTSWSSQCLSEQWCSPKLRVWYHWSFHSSLHLELGIQEPCQDPLKARHKQALKHSAWILVWPVTAQNKALPLYHANTLTYSCFLWQKRQSAGCLQDHFVTYTSFSHQLSPLYSPKSSCIWKNITIFVMR